MVALVHTSLNLCCRFVIINNKNNNRRLLVKCAAVLFMSCKMMQVTWFGVNHFHVESEQFFIAAKKLQTSEAHVVLVAPRLSETQHEI